MGLILILRTGMKMLKVKRGYALKKINNKELMLEKK